MLLIKLINEDEIGFHWEESYEYGGDIVKMSKTCQKAESFYGLGDKPVDVNLKGNVLKTGQQTLMLLVKIQTQFTKQFLFTQQFKTIKLMVFSLTILLKLHFDFAHERRNVTSFWAQGGEMNYYFIYGPKMEDVVKNYTDLTG